MKLRTLLILFLLYTVPAQASEIYRVTKVYDGDTIHVVDSHGVVIKVRLLGIDTPEVGYKNECYSGEARDYLDKRINGQEVRLMDGEDKIDPFGRKLAYVYLKTTDINHELIKLGFSYVYPSSDLKVLKRYVASERKARIDGVGLWGKCRR